MKARNILFVSILLIVSIGVLAVSRVERGAGQDLAVNECLAGLDRLYVIIDVSGTQAQKSLIDVDKLHDDISDILKDSGITVFHGARGGSLPKYELRIPELVINIEFYTPEGAYKYVFRTQASFAAKVNLAKDSDISFKADIWKSRPRFGDTTRKEGDLVVASVLGQVAVFTEIKNKAVPRPKQKNNEQAKTVLPVVPTRPVPLEVESDTHISYVASANSKVFHESTCSSAKRIKTSNMIAYRNRDEALTAGKTPCKMCNP